MLFYIRFNQGYYLALAAQIFTYGLDINNLKRITCYKAIYSANTFRSFYTY